MCLWRFTCFHLGGQHGLRGERQQADDVAHGAVGLFSEVSSQFQGVVSGNETQEYKHDSSAWSRLFEYKNSSGKTHLTLILSEETKGK